MDASGEVRIAANGDTIEWFAWLTGVPAERIAQDPANRDLIDAGRSVTLLEPGDRVYIPPRRLRDVSRSTEARHVFTVQRPRRHIHVRFVRGEEPRANTAYQLTLDEDTRRDGVTDGDGYLEQHVPLGCQQAVVHFADDPEDLTYTLLIGHLNPVHSVSGTMQRLRNLNYFWGPIPEEWTREAKLALGGFQRDQGLPTTGERDEETLAALVKAHGS
jgi:hypothetical protein